MDPWMNSLMLMWRTKTIPSVNGLVVLVSEVFFLIINNFLEKFEFAVGASPFGFILTSCI